MNIVFIIDQVYRHGGIEKILSVKANYFSNLPNFNVSILTTEQKDKAFCYQFNPTIQFLDININYHRNKSYFHPVNLLKLPKHILKLSSVLKQIQPDIVVVCSHSTDTYFIPFINRNIPKIKEFHYSKFIEIEPRKHPKSFIQRWFFKFADYVEKKYNKLVVLNDDEATYYPSKNVEVIPNPVTFTSDKVASLQNKIAIAVGRIAPVKGFDDLIDIWEKVIEHDQEWKLHIYGDGETDYVTYLQELIQHKQLKYNLILKGNTNNVKEVLLEGSMYLMTSHNECFPLVLLEAQTCGLPILAFDCPHGPRNIISKSNGVLIPNRDKNLFANEIIALVKDRDRLINMGAEAKKNVATYTLENVMNKWVTLFKSLKN